MNYPGYVAKEEGHQGGYFAIQALYKSAQQLGVEFRFLTTATSIAMDNGAVSGVYATDKDGSTVLIACRAAVIATGGYADSREAFEKYTYFNFDSLMNYGPGGRNGDGIRMGEELGAAMHHPDCVNFCNPGLRGEKATAWITAIGVNQPTCIWVDTDGNRFVDEAAVFDWTLSANAITQVSEMYSVIDQSLIEMIINEGVIKQAPMDIWVGDKNPDAQSIVDEAVQDGEFAFVADTVEELAVKLGIDPDNLASTIKRYNEFCEKGADGDFVKDPAYLRPIATPPFYGFTPKLGLYNTCGGLKVDAASRVLDKEQFKPIPGLYAAGSDAGGIFGFNYDIAVAAGIMQAWCANSGKLAAENIVNEYLA